MGVSLVIDDSLMRQALKATGLSSKKAVIVKVHGQRSIRRLRGKIVFDDVLNRKGMK